MPARSDGFLRPQLPAALAAQAGGTLIAAAAYALAGARYVPPPVTIVFVQSAAAILIAWRLRQPSWWLLIHLFFAPAIVSALTLALDARWYLAGFVLLALVFGGVHHSRVPLYFSSGAATEALLALLPRDSRVRFLDVGCGIGSVLERVSRMQPGADCAGVETALLPWLIASLRARRGARYQVRRASLWDTHLGQSDVVYAYLSPAAMASLWTKAKREMKPGSLLISNSFSVPQARADEVRSWSTRAGDLLYVYRM